ncbi:MAG: holo-ACP synthase [Planctomycetia bacterium]|nr:MAG: holo-ACP synthase [Planctomycetia bacterium]
MRIVGHGVDIVVVSRVERLRERHGDVFMERVFTPAERAYCDSARGRAERLAGRFAAKEAVFKVLGSGWRGSMQWTDVETLPDALGKPVITLHGESARRAAEMGIARVLISLSHAGGYAVASALGVSDT